MSLEEHRRAIDELDRELVDLLNARARHAQMIGRLKADSGEAVYKPDREQQVLNKICDANSGPFPHESLRNIYREIISATRALEQPLKVAYLGPASTYTHQAARAQFGATTEYLPQADFGEIFRIVERHEADFGVVPIENTTEGVVTHTVDQFIESDLYICAEIALNITHMLMGLCSLEDVETVYSHPQGIAQCRGWLAANLPGVNLEETSSTSAGAERAAGDPHGAAIASALAAEHFGLNILANRIEDIKQNFTRFFVIGRERPGMSGKDKTSLVFSVQHKVGALSEILQVFAKDNLNLTRIESRPSRRKAWEYVFFVDFEGHVDDPRVKAALEDVAGHCVYLKHLGSYPAADDISRA